MFLYLFHSSFSYVDEVVFVLLQSVCYCEYMYVKMCIVEEGNERKEMKELCNSGFDTLTDVCSS